MADRSLTVRLRAEVDQFRKNMEEAAKATEGVGAAAENAGRSSKALDLLGQAGRDVGRIIGAATGAAAASMAALAAATIATGVQYNTLEQTSRAALTTLLGSAEAANEQMDKLRQFGSTSPFPRQVWIEAQQQLLAFGMAAERIIPTLSAIQDAVAAAGGSAVDIQEIVRVLAQVQSTGTVTAETLNQLGTRGIDAAALIGSAFGQSAAEIRDSISSGAIDAATFLEVLTEQMTARFGGAAANVRTTWVGATDRIKGALRDIGSVTVTPFIDPAGGGAAVEWANRLADVLRAVERQLRPLVAELRQRANPTFQAVSDRLQNLVDVIDRLDLVELVDRIRPAVPAFAALAAGISAAGGAAVLSAVGFGGLAGAISPLGAAITAAAVASPELRQALTELVVELQPLIPAMIEAGIAAGSMVTTGLVLVADVISVVAPLVGVLVDAFGMLPDSLQSATLGLAGFALALRFGGPLGAAIAGLALLGATIDALGLSGERVRSDVNGLTTDIERLIRSGQASAELRRLFGDGADGAAEFADKLDVATASFFDWSNHLNRTFDEIRAADQAFTDLDTAMASLVREGHDADTVFQSLVDTYGLTEEQVARLLPLLPQFTAEQERQALAAGEQAGAQDRVTTAVERATAAMKEQHDEMRAQADPVFALHRALRQVEQAQSTYDRALKEHGETSTEAKDAAIALFEATLELQGAAAATGGAFDGKLTPAMRATLEAAGLTEAQIDAVEKAFKDAAAAGKDFADDYTARVQVHGAKEAERQARMLRDRLREIDRFINIHFSVTGQAPIGSVRTPFALGGPVEHGPPGIDRVPAMLTRGEHVWTVQEVQAAGGHAAVEAMRAAVLAGQTRFALPASRGRGGGSPQAVLVIRGDGTARADFVVRELARSAELAGGLQNLVRLEVGR